MTHSVLLDLQFMILRVVLLKLVPVACYDDELLAGGHFDYFGGIRRIIENVNRSMPPIGLHTAVTISRTHEQISFNVNLPKIPHPQILYVAECKPDSAIISNMITVCISFFECLHYLMLSEIAQGAYDLDNAMLWKVLRLQTLTLSIKRDSDQ
uniref:Uncharacterized protein n=1 Tax=Glossina pallidipes TaxID=7398 RepID=A0A1A9ZBR5_GLOPL